MNQFGMSMPGGQLQRTVSMNVYTGLLALSVLALIGACAFVYLQGAKVAPDGQPFKLQEYNEGTRTYNIQFKQGS